MRLLKTRPGRCSGHFIAALAVTGLAATTPVAAFTSSAPICTTTPISLVGTQRTGTWLLWSTMAAVHPLNLSGNYSVLRDVFVWLQVVSNAAGRVGCSPASRKPRVDFVNALLLAPTYTEPPSVARPGVIRVHFYFRPAPNRVVLRFSINGSKAAGAATSRSARRRCTSDEARQSRAAPPR
jgi:hypothetical protein